MHKDVKFGGYFHPFPIRKNIKVIERAELTLKRQIDTVMWYQQWGAPFGIKHFHPKWVESVGQRDVVIKWEPKKNFGKPDSTFSIASILNGTHDTYIREWAIGIAKLNRHIYLCPMPEMNGNWYGWSTAAGDHTPADFIAAWKHLRDIFDTEGAHNVAWLWNANAGDVPEDNYMEAYYPGDDYVDVLGLSIYNWGTTRPWSKWRSFSDIAQPYYDRVAKLGSQPIWVAEMGCAPKGGDKEAWIQDMWECMPSLKRIETVLWFNMKKETDWRATEVPKAFWKFATKQG